MSSSVDRSDVHFRFVRLRVDFWQWARAGHRVYLKWDKRKKIIVDFYYFIFVANRGDYAIAEYLQMKMDILNSNRVFLKHFLIGFQANVLFVMLEDKHFICIGQILISCAFQWFSSSRRELDSKIESDLGLDCANYNAWNNRFTVGRWRWRRKYFITLIMYEVHEFCNLHCYNLCAFHSRHKWLVRVFWWPAKLRMQIHESRIAVHRTHFSLSLLACR